MAPRPPGRPREFDRDDALRQAAHLFWLHGFSGTSTRMLTAALRISSSSLYASFGTKAELFDEAVRAYALRYSAIYDRALGESTVTSVIQRLLLESVAEFTRTNEGHPGCLTNSGVMSDTSATLDVRAFVADLQRADEARLRDRLEQAALDGSLSQTVNPFDLAELIQTIWQGLSTRAELGASRDELLNVADLALQLISSVIQETVLDRPTGSSCQRAPDPRDEGSVVSRHED
ncbi:TetR/AcrR family transcriptional regulator [Nesterenkonia haasae]|uniref:TetR/AcrR family transcriptional regulator n=1 Tax=Nesterenkonia haasae TaxID=2587813 RepID=UPI0013909116|nr:TetR/AcrR family transcriptional regulator [Nesterenkonia haasae]NDK31808.1 TetR/AcrR family transcriptional regulator [Nesterenkonia haasae]